MLPSSGQNGLFEWRSPSHCANCLAGVLRFPTEVLQVVDGDHSVCSTRQHAKQHRHRTTVLRYFPSHNFGFYVPSRVCRQQLTISPLSSLCRWCWCRFHGFCRRLCRDLTWDWGPFETNRQRERGLCINRCSLSSYVAKPGGSRGVTLRLLQRQLESNGCF